MTHPDATTANAGPAVLPGSPYSDRPTSDAARAINWFRGESVSGVLLIIGAAVAVIWSNTPWASGYVWLQDVTVGPESLGLSMPLAKWAADGLLAIFFFVIGVELKRDFVTGDLASMNKAIIPIAAAVGGMAVPAVVYILFNGGLDTVDGWAIPSATDIAFAVAVLSIVGRRLPTAMRAFLLTLAVVDDLLAILIIAVNYTASLNLVWVAGCAACVVVFALLLNRGITAWWIIIPVAVGAWYLLFQSGVHATIAGVALGLVVPARPLTSGDAASRRHPFVAPGASLVDRFEWKVGPVSAGFAVPVFAFLSAGVVINGDSLAAAASDPVALGIASGLLVGKPIGITAATWLVCRFKSINLAPGVGWLDILGLGMLAGIGFTVSMLITELAFGAGSVYVERGITAVLLASTTAALIGGTFLYYRGKVHAARAS